MAQSVEGFPPAAHKHYTIAYLHSCCAILSIWKNDRVYFKFGADNVPGTAQELSPDRRNSALCRGRGKRDSSACCFHALSQSVDLLDTPFCAFDRHP